MMSEYGSAKPFTGSLGAVADNFSYTTPITTFIYRCNQYEQTIKRDEFNFLLFLFFN